MKPQQDTIIDREPASLWENRSYVHLWIGRFFAQFGDKIYLLALPWLVLELTGSVISATLTLALEIVPEVLLAPFVGIIADRISRKKLMVITDVLRGVFILCVPILFVFDILHIGYIYFLAVALSILTLLFDSASQAYIPTILHKDQLMDGNSKLVMVATIMRVVGPAAAGLLIAYFGVANAMTINGVSFMLSALFLLFILDTKATAISVDAHDPLEKESKPKDKDQKADEEVLRTFAGKFQSFKADVAEGLRYVFKHKVLWPITLFSALMNFGILGVTSLFIFESKENQEAGADVTSMIFWVSGIFSFLATLLVKPFSQKVSKGQLIRYGSIGVGIAIGIVAVKPSILTMTISYTLLLMIGIFVNVSMMTLRQEIVPNHLLGRVMASTRVLVTSISPVAIILAGLVAKIWSVQTVFIIGTVLIGLNILIAWTTKLRTVE